ncbi:hypothetical protein FN846DRAFT_174972 [Sphaerosporella brunnea]|uniref:Uncharacterized protein n=1 Tax=Sphaerosporella brunnea TaxID=1250544 RepID=A0A5J5EQ36_9PEZI|nr:hypothetical protein FN846DRAFT_174972 [Sphaerosporella brunnea]
MSGSMMSNVGNRQVYEAGDQRTNKSTDTDPREFAYEEGQKNSHKLDDPKDQRSLANRLAAAEKKDREREDHSEAGDPRAPAWHHGNEPSKGAKIDAELQKEDEELLARKAKKGTDAMTGKKN